MKRGWEILAFILLLVVVVLFVILAVLHAPATTPESGGDMNVLDKLGPRTAVALVFAMILLLAWFFWLVIQFGRRLSERGYLGPA